MQIFSQTLGPFGTNCYILDFSSSQSNAKEFYAIDAPWDALAFIESHAKKTGQTLSKLFLTHSHQDHIADTAALMEKFPDLKVYIAKNELSYLCQPGTDGLPIALPFSKVCTKQHSRIIALPIQAPPATPFSIPEETQDLLPTLFHCPGHSPGSICYHFPSYNALFSGDTLMHGTCGRVDLPGGSKEAMVKTLKTMISHFSEDTIVYPGHGPETTIGSEAPWALSIEHML